MEAITTNLEKAVILGICFSEYNDGHDVENMSPWVFSVTAQDPDTKEELTRNQVGGVISSLVKKGIVLVADYGKSNRTEDSYLYFTHEAVPFVQGLYDEHREAAK